jgi:hypothetical protein
LAKGLNGEVKGSGSGVAKMVGLVDTLYLATPFAFVAVFGVGLLISLLQESERVIDKLRSWWPLLRILALIGKKPARKGTGSSIFKF